MPNAPRGAFFCFTLQPEGDEEVLSKRAFASTRLMSEL
jgi:hypothetical protein